MKLQALVIALALGFGAGQAGAAARCDVNGDGMVDSRDATLIMSALGQNASGPNDPRDANGDGKITVADARSCATVCTYAGCAASTLPASMQLSLPQLVVGAGSAVTLTPKVLDNTGQAISPAPIVILKLATPAPNTTSGAAPVLGGTQVSTGSSTRGSFTVEASVRGTGISTKAVFTVLQNATQSANSGLYVNLSGAQASLVSNVGAIQAALQRGDSAAVQAASNALAAAAAGVNANAMSLSTPYEPDSGFVPTGSEAASRGFPPTQADANFAALNSQLRAKLAQIRQLLDQPSGNAAADTAALGQYAADLEALWAQSQAAANRPSVYGLTSNSLAVNDLLAQDMPTVLKSVAARVNADLQQNGLVAAAALPAAAGPRARPSRLPYPAPRQPTFLLTGLLGYAGNIGGLIQRIYGDYLDQVQKMAILLAAQGLLNQYLSQTAGVGGLITGASQSFHAYHMPGSVIEVTGVTLADAQTANVFLIGGAAVNAVSGLINQFRSLGQISSIRQVFDFYKGMLDALQSAGKAYADAHQQPDSAFATSFWDGGCLSSLADACVELVYDNGFNYVGSGGPIKLEPVIILVRARSPQNPQFGSGIFNFVGS
ncbi:MAG: hypothetical protein AMXMBFR66_29140 [Pseudomonadota bacterium]|nr:hypothetical protein [Rubrivivax sp.]